MNLPANLMLAASISLFMGGAALAEQKGGTSGPATGKNVVPSTVIQKLQENRSSSDQQEALPPVDDGGAAAGYPGVEGLPGSESGQAPPRQDDAK
jgi:hypothetical protein